MKNSISRLAAVLLPAVLLTVSCEKSQESEPVKLTAPVMTLDMATQNDIMAIFRSLAHDEGKCVIIVTHSPQVAEQSDEVFTLPKRR